MWAQSVTHQQDATRTHQESQDRFKKRAKLATTLQASGLKYSNSMASELLRVDAYDTPQEPSSKMISMDEHNDDDADEA
jgi:hypothetical protein